MKKYKVILSVLLCIFLISLANITNYSKDYSKITIDSTHMSNDLNAIAYGKGIFVAVGENGIIKISKDGIDWTVEKSPLSDNLIAIAFNGSVFVAIGSKNIIFSYDGVSWKTALDALTSLDDYYSYYTDICSNGHNFVLSGNGILGWSTNGIKWTFMKNLMLVHPQAQGLNADLFSNVFCNNNSFVALNSTKGIFFVSKDGAKWNQVKIPKNTFTNTFNNYTFNCINKTYILMSTDNNTHKKYVYTSSDFNNWKSTEANEFYKFKSVNNINYVFGNNKIFVTSDAINYTAIFNLPKAKNINDIAYNGKIYVAVGTDNLSLFSKDGRTYKYNQSQSFKTIYSSATNNNIIVSVGLDGQILTSVDGGHWIKQDSKTNETLRSVIWDGSRFTAVGDKGIILSSSNGTSWSKLDSPSSNNLFKIEYFKFIYIAVGDNNSIITSNDGTNWSKTYGSKEITNDDDHRYNKIFFDGRTYYAVTNSNTRYITSQDGFKWTLPTNYGYFRSNIINLFAYKDKYIIQTSNSSNSLNLSKTLISGAKIANCLDSNIGNMSSCFINGNQVLIGTDNGTILVSADGVQWKDAITQKLNEPIYSISNFKGYIYFFCNDGLIGKMKSSNMLYKTSPITIQTVEFTLGNINPTIKIEVPSVQPYFKNNVIMMDLKTISSKIKAVYYYNKKSKAAIITKNGLSVKVIINSNYAYVNKVKTKIKIKPDLKNNFVFVPAQFVINSLGYTFKYGDFERRIYINDDTSIKDRNMKWSVASYDKKPASMYFNSICYNKKVYVASTRGQIYISRNGVSWNQAANLNVSSFSSIIWNGKYFIATGNSTDSSITPNPKSIIYTSLDGTKWSKSNTNIYSNILCAASNGINTVIACYNGKFYITSNGAKWVNSFYANKSDMYTIVFYKGKYIIAGRDTSCIYTSKDGLKWSCVKSNLHIANLAIVDNEVFGFAYNTVYKTVDGKTWSKVLDLPVNDYLDMCLKDSNGYVMFGYSNRGIGQLIYTSKNKAIWNRALGSKSFLSATSVIYDGKKIIASTDSGICILNRK